MADLHDQENVDEPHQSLSSLICNEEYDFVISQNGQKIHSKLMKKGEAFKIVCGGLTERNGKIQNSKAMDLIGKYGIHPIHSQVKARGEAQTLEQILVPDHCNFVIKHGSAKVLVSELVGKTVALYFSAHWCPPCRTFTPKLIQAYNELKERGEPFEIVFISSDRDQKAFEEYYSSMPWLAFPFGDTREDHLDQIFHVQGIPALIVIGPNGETVTVNGRRAVSEHGANAYPFTDAHLASLQERRWSWGYCWSCLRNCLRR